MPRVEGIERKIPDWDSYFMRMLPLLSSRSKDKQYNCAAIIVGPNHEIRSTGYNSLVRGINDNVPERLERPEKYYWMEHAERNAIYSAARVGTPTEGCTCYVSAKCCMDCARALVQAGIVRVVYGEKEQESWNSPKYLPDFERVGQLFKEANIVFDGWKDE